MVLNMQNIAKLNKMGIVFYLLSEIKGDWKKVSLSDFTHLGLAPMAFYRGRDDYFNKIITNKNEDIKFTV